VELINKNPKKNECVIVATYNALAWTGRSVDYKEIRKVAKTQFGYTRKTGVKSDNISGMLEHFGVNAKQMKIGKTLFEGIDSLFRGKAVLICYHFKGRTMGHMAMVTPDFQLVNPEDSLPNWPSLFKAIYNGNVNFCVWILRGKKP
jgi:hypothetical protein